MRWGIALFWAIVIAALHAIPGQDLVFIQLDDLFQLDKFFHFEFAIIYKIKLSKVITLGRFSI